MRSFPRFVALTFLAFATEFAEAAPATVEELERQIQELRTEMNLYRIRQEDLYFESTERSSAVRSFFADRLFLGGFYETALTGMWGEDTRTQIAPSSNALGLNLSATFSTDFKFVTQVLTVLNIPISNPENDPRTTPNRRQFGTPGLAATPAQGYVEYRVSDGFRLHAGLGYVPFGFAPQQRELVLFVRRGGPQLLRSPELLEPLWSGLHVAGHFAMESGRWGYDAYTFPYLNYTQMIGAGARLWWESAEETLRLGISSQMGRTRTGGAMAIGADARLKLGRLNLVSEFAQRDSGTYRPWTVYFEPNYEITPSFLVFGYVDYADASSNRTVIGGALADAPYLRLEYGGGVNWLPTSFTRFRAGLFFFDYRGATASIAGQNRDFAALDLSAGVAF